MTDEHKAIVPQEVGVQPRPDEQLDVAPVVQRILDGGISPEALEQLQWIDSLQKRHDEKQELAAFTRSMVAMKADPDFASVIRHDTKVAFGQTKYSYTSLPAMVAELTPHLTKYGFSISWVPEYNGERKVGVTCRLFHISGHIEEAYLPSALTQKKGMSNAQEVTGTQTTLKRNTVLSLLGLASGEMEVAQKQANGSDLANGLDVETALNAMASVGISRDEVKANMEKPIAEITKHDLDEMRLWYRERTEQG